MIWPVLVCSVPYRVERLLAAVGLRLLNGHLVALRFQLGGVKHACVTQRNYKRLLLTVVQTIFNSSSDADLAQCSLFDRILISFSHRAWISSEIRIPTLTPNTLIWKWSTTCGPLGVWTYCGSVAMPIWTVTWKWFFFWQTKASSAEE